ncbi:hypothetical protein ACS0TY_009758 [Phlomoides rotata]
MPLHHLSPNVPHFGRTIVHHAVLCGNSRALEVLLNCGADIEFHNQTSQHTDVRPVHLASRLGLATILGLLIGDGCNVKSRTGPRDTALMICVKYKQEECLKLLASAGSNFGLCNTFGESTTSIDASVRWTRSFQRTVLDVIQAGKVVKSSNSELELNIDEKDENEFSAVMVAAAMECKAQNRPLIGEERKGRGMCSTGRADMKARAKWGFCEEAHKEGQRGASYKDVEMVEVAGVLHWGKSSKRNVICRG